MLSSRGSGASQRSPRRRRRAHAADVLFKGERREGGEEKAVCIRLDSVGRTLNCDRNELAG